MAIIIPFVVLVACFIYVKKLSKGKTDKRKYIVWGTTIAFIIAPLVSWIISSLYGIGEESGFAVIALMAVIFPPLFLIGIVVLLIGLFKKESRNESI